MATGPISAHVVAISDALLRSMFMTKLKMTAAAILILLSLGGGVGLWASWNTDPAAGVARNADDDRRGDGRRGDDDDRERKPIAAEVLVPAKGEPGDVIKRGQYLVNTVARCGDCHTPRTKTGELDMAKHLQARPSWFTPKIKPKGEVADRASDITMSGRAGLWSEAKMVKFLSTGARSDYPMPAYNMTVDDARAVTAYLRSLPGRKKDGKKRED